MLTTPKGLPMYERHDRPDRTTLEDVVAFVRVARDEVRTVGYETAGVVAGHLAQGLAHVTLVVHTAAGSWRGRADELAPSHPVPNYWSIVEQDLTPLDPEQLHQQAERAAAMSRHPSAPEGP